MNFVESGRQFIYSIVASPVKYHGLLNQGATCYLNSVLQVLFMTEDFREAVQRHTCENHTECIDHYLTALFDDLKRGTAYTYNITKKLGIDRVCEQRDAAEYFEKILRLTSPEASHIFHGLLTHKTICSRCHAETDTNGPFWHLPLALVDSMNNEDYSVVNGIEEYFRASCFSGENQMYCDQCDGKSDATLKCVIKHHPEVLMLLLKRFEFDYRYMTYVKNNRTVDVPCTLQIPKNQTYELYAVVKHFGDLRSGHYTATIKSRDDERWYSFNDDRVTLFDYQSFQVDGFKSFKSRDAYLLFYRKKNAHAADTCTQDIRGVSTPGGLLPATSDIYYQCQDALNIRGEKEVEQAAEAGNDTAVWSRGEGLTPDLCCNAEDQGNGVHAGQSRPNNHQEHNEEGNELHPQDHLTEKQKDEGKIITDEEEDMGGKAEVDDQAEKRETLSQLEESVKDQDNDSGRLDGIRQRRPQEVLESNVIHNTSYKHKQEVSNMRARGDYPQQVQQRDKEIKVKASTKYLDRDAEHQDNEGSEDIRQNTYEDLGGTQEVGQDYDHKPVSVDTQRGEEMMEIDVKADKEGNTGADERERASGSPKLLTKYDLYNSEIPVSGRVGDSQQNRPKDHQRCEEGDSNRYKRHEQREKVDVKGDREQKRGDDKYAQRRETSMTKPYLTEGVEDQDKRRLDGVRQRRPREDPEQKICVTRRTHKYVSVDKQGGEERMRADVKVDKEGETAADERGMASGRGNYLTKYDLYKYKIPVSGRVGDSQQNRPKDHHLTEGVEDQDKRVDGVRQKRPQKDPEQKICDTRTTHQYVSVDKQQESKGDNEHIQDRADSSLRRAGFAGSTRLTENQRVGNVEKTRQGDSQPKARVGINEHRVEGRPGSKKSRLYYGKIIEEEFRETPSGTQRSSKTSNIRIETVEGTSQDGIKSQVEYDEGNDPKTDAKVTLSRGVGKLKLSESPLPEPQTRRTKGLSVQARIKRAREKSMHRKKRRWWRHSSPLKKDSKDKNKRKKTTGCFSCFSLERRKNAAQTSESD